MYVLYHSIPFQCQNQDNLTTETALTGPIDGFNYEVLLYSYEQHKQVQMEGLFNTDIHSGQVGDHVLYMYIRTYIFFKNLLEQCYA